jgi:hypothetical protein
VISRMPRFRRAPIPRKPVTAVNAVAAQVRGPATAADRWRKPVTRPPKTGYTTAGSRWGTPSTEQHRRAPDLRLCAWPTGITAVTGFAGKGALGALGRAKNEAVTLVTDDYVQRVRASRLEAVAA